MGQSFGRGPCPKCGKIISSCGLAQAAHARSHEKDGQPKVEQNRAWYQKCKVCKSSLPQEPNAQREYRKHKRCKVCMSQAIEKVDEVIEKAKEVKNAEDPRLTEIYKKLNALHIKDADTYDPAEHTKIRDEIHQLNNEVLKIRQERSKALGEMMTERK